MNKIIIFSFLFLILSFKIQQEKFQFGQASYYASKFEGKKTSSGEIYNSSLMTAAHKNLAFGTMVLVTNLKNDSVVELKINDRLGKSSGSIIDVSFAAAKKLNFVKSGHSEVKIEVLN